MVLASLIIAIMVIGKSFLVPLTWSLLIALASVGLIEKVFDLHTFNPGTDRLLFLH